MNGSILGQVGPFYADISYAIDEAVAQADYTDTPCGVWARAA